MPEEAGLVGLTHAGILAIFSNKRCRIHYLYLWQSLPKSFTASPRSLGNDNRSLSELKMCVAWRLIANSRNFSSLASLRYSNRTFEVRHIFADKTQSADRYFNQCWRDFRKFSAIASSSRTARYSSRTGLLSSGIKDAFQRPVAPWPQPSERTLTCAAACSCR